MAAVFGSRVRRTAVTTAVAAAAVAALAASQAPGATNDQARDDRAGAADTTPSPDGDSATGDSPYYTDLPPLKSPVPPSSKPGGGVAIGDKEAGLPATVLDAYKKAEAAVRESRPGCNLPWQLLAAIGKVESGQARGGRVDADGTTLTPILGPVLDGNGFAKITDTDRGAFDGDTTHDRAVGPMQFIPSTWSVVGVDGDSDGTRNPQDIDDAALATAVYLCSGEDDLSSEPGQRASVYRYNHSNAYVRAIRWASDRLLASPAGGSVLARLTSTTGETTPLAEATTRRPRSPSRLKSMARALGLPTRGTTNANRLRRVEGKSRVVVLVTDGERALLGRQAAWPPGRYSAIAGFVEPEDASSSKKPTQV